MSKTFKVGDRVKVVGDYRKGETGRVLEVKSYTCFTAVRVVVDGYPYVEPSEYHSFGFHELELIAGEGKPMKTWGEMIREEKGELLLAQHEGKIIQLFTGYGEWIDLEDPLFVRTFPYRVKPEPEVETVEMYGAVESSGYYCFGYKLKSFDTHKITFDVVDGVVDCNSVKMEEIA